MNKKKFKVAGIALCMSMAAVAVGAAVGASLKAPVEAKAASATTKYSLINSTSDLEVNKSYIITSGTSGTVYAMSKESSDNNRKAVETTVSAGKITRGSDILSLTLGGESGAWTFKTENYAGTAGFFTQGNQTSKNYLKIDSNGDGFTISFDGDAAVITSTLKSSRNLVRYNTSNKLFACYTSGQDPVYLWKEVAGASVTGVCLNKASTEIEAGNTETLVATVAPGDAGNKNVTWTSSDPAIATVSDAGVVTALTPGSATITVTTVDGGFTATCEVTVTGSVVSVTGVELNKTSATITVGDTEELLATVLPENATTQTVNWSSSDEEVATVDANGLVTAIKKGSATITVTTVDGGFTATCDVTVENVPVTSVAFDKHEVNLYLGVAEKLTATVGPAEATDKSLTWTSSDAEVATVSQYGNITPVGFGTATIKAASKNNPEVFDECVVNVSKFIALGETDTDSLDRAFTGNETTSYKPWSGKLDASDAVYAGNSAGGNDSIQLRSTNNSGIVATASGGYAKKVTVTWNDQTAENRTLDIYGKDAAYESTADLFNSNSQGVKLGSIVNGTSTVLEISKPCQFIGLRSSSGAMYISSIEIEWVESYAAFDDIAAVHAFIEGNMHLAHVADDGSCKGWYADAKAAFTALTADQKAIILQGDEVYKVIDANEWKYTDVRDRLAAWAKANNDTFDPNNGTFSAAGVINAISANGSQTLVWSIGLITIGAIAATGLFLVQRKRKQN